MTPQLRIIVHDPQHVAEDDTMALPVELAKCVSARVPAILATIEFLIAQVAEFLHETGPATSPFLVQPCVEPVYPVVIPLAADDVSDDKAVALGRFQADRNIAIGGDSALGISRHAAFLEGY